MRVRVGLCIFLAAGGIGVHQARAEVATVPLDLTWNAPRDCPDESAVRASLLRLLSVGESPSRRLKADITVEKSAALVWTLRLRTELDGISGERVLSGRLCGTVTDAAILTLALMLNPEAVLARDATNKISGPTVSSEAGTKQKETPAVVPTASYRRSARPPRLMGESQLGLQWGILPQVGPDLGLGLGIAWGSASTWLRVGYDPPQDASLPETPGVGGRLWAASAAIFGCWAIGDRAPSFAPCLGGELSRVDGHGTGVNIPRQAVTYWVSPLFGAFSDIPLRANVAIRLTAFGLVPLARPKSYLDALGQVHRPSVVDAKVHAGVIFVIP